MKIPRDWTFNTADVAKHFDRRVRLLQMNCLARLKSSASETSPDG